MPETTRDTPPPGASQTPRHPLDLRFPAGVAYVLFLLIVVSPAVELWFDLGAGAARGWTFVAGGLLAATLLAAVAGFRAVRAELATAPRAEAEAGEDPRAATLAAVCAWIACPVGLIWSLSGGANAAWELFEGPAYPWHSRAFLPLRLIEALGGAVVLGAGVVLLFSLGRSRSRIRPALAVAAGGFALLAASYAAMSVVDELRWAELPASVPVLRPLLGFLNPMSVAIVPAGLAALCFGARRLHAPQGEAGDSEPATSP
ncbi:MAG: hypothetical protein L0216_15565 [Planctomycetales bacterium]|nr:hypothetical protein [Planctomycetales bacterium]